VQDVQSPKTAILPSPSGLSQALHAPASVCRHLCRPVMGVYLSVDVYQLARSIALINLFHCINLLGDLLV
jgi:hypothetical protein